MKNDDDMELLYEQALNMTDELCETHSGMAVAAVLNTISLSLYRTILTEEEYHEMLRAINDASRLIKPFTPAGYVN